MFIYVKVFKILGYVFFGFFVVVSGYGLGGGMMNTSNMHGNLLTGVKGPFSLTQWAELEQQALIYKYITANVPVPSSLLLSLKKSFFPYGSLPPNSCKFSLKILYIVNQYFLFLLSL